MTKKISEQIQEKAPIILAEIKKAKSVLLHCHPSPDPDSVCSALAMKFAVEQLGIKVTVIKGDSEIPQAFMHFPGARDIVSKNFFEINLNDFDLFLSLDSSSLDRISMEEQIIFPDSLKVINIDHHRTNTNFGSINLVVSDYPATSQVLYDLFSEWNLTIGIDIATNLLVGIYTDTGGFKYRDTNSRTFMVAGELSESIPDFAGVIARMENSRTIEDTIFLGAGLSSIEVFCNEKIVISTINNSFITENNIPDGSISASSVSSNLRKMGNYEVMGALVEARPNLVRCSFRSGNSEKCDVSLLAAAFGGGGHKGAAGATLNMPLLEAKATVVEKIKELYNL